MANTKEIKDRIKSVKDTQKIAKAMYLISSTKMRKAKAELDGTRPYFSALKREIGRIFGYFEDIQSRYFYSKDYTAPTDKPDACLVITADKGLSGAYNQNAIKEAEKLLKINPDTKLFVVGEYGRQYFMRHNIPVEQSFLYTAQNPTMGRAREICRTLLDLYDSRAADEIYIIYTDLKRDINQRAETVRLLPLERGAFKATSNKNDRFEFWPDAVKVLESIVPAFLTGFIYSALVDSFCSEQNARMMAMSASNDNAEAIVSKLSMQYNHLRQADITREITEVTAGAKAQIRKRKARESGNEHRKNS
ncbi:MAG: ATP synthase F1 subunit gamma [Clostridia bacterium]|nr:ATP synthase F1 subunit gamma [Clostridia bacterium]